MINNLFKYLILYIAFGFITFALYYPIDIFSQKGIELQKEILLKQAQTHFHDQVNTRKWNAMYGGVYAKPLKGQKPNPYLQNNTLKVDENLTLIKINPAWMTRQLSEISDIKEFHFRITSLTPINPNNEATPFEKRALEYFEKSNDKEYFEFANDNKFRYMGALVTRESCLPCHKHQGYKLGDIRGGISVNLDSSKYSVVTASIKDNALIVKTFVILFLLSIAFLVHKQLRNNERLKIEVVKRTKEIESTKQLLQKILDADLSFLLLSDDTEVIFTNKTLLDFFGFESLKEFKEKYSHISDTFEHVDNEYFLSHFIDGEHWIPFLQREQNSKELKVLIKKDGVDRYFKPHAKEITIENKKLYLIIFDEITKELKKIKKLEKEASTDSLTKLFNRTKFNDVLLKGMELSDETSSPLSLIFLDIDNFKNVNDTYGHNEGDKVLIDLSKILLSSLRQGDFVARWGGEEFIIILQSTQTAKALEVAEKLRKNFESHSFEGSGRQTLSCGVTEYISGESRDQVLKRVDEALYKAKQSGRNRVVAY